MIEFFRKNPNAVFFIVAMFVALWVIRFYLKRHKIIAEVSPTDQEGIEKLATAEFDKKNKSVYFNFSGHAWDAFEVLGLPPGSPEDEIEEAYKEALSSVDQGSQEFIRMAYEAIQQKH